MSEEVLALVGIACAPSGADRFWAALLNGCAAGADEREMRVTELVRDALRDAGLEVGDEPPARTVVVEGGVASVLSRARNALADDGVDLAVVVGPGRRGAAVVLERRADAESSCRAAYALLRGEAPGEARVGYVEVAAEHTFPPGGLRGLCVPDAPAMQPVGGFGGSGLASLVKLALALSHKVIPPASPDTVPRAVTEAMPTFVNLEVRPWFHDPASGPRRGVLVGAGAPVVLEEVVPAPSGGGIRPRSIRIDVAWERELVLLAARTREGLQRRMRELCAWLDACPTDVRLADVAHTLSRTAAPDARCRLAIVCRDLEGLRARLERYAEDLVGADNPAEGTWYEEPAGPPGKLACLFPGLAYPGLQGVYADHLHDLCLHFPEVRSILDRVDRRPGDPMPTHLIAFPPRALPEAMQQRFRDRWALIGLDHAAKQDAFEEANLCHYGVTIANWATWRILEALRVPVDMLFGQSEGDLSALCAAGALSFPVVLDLHTQYRIAEDHIPFDGELALIHAESDRLGAIIDRHPHVDIAIHLTPTMQLVGGEAARLEGFCAEVRGEGIAAQKLPFPAVHTPAFSHLIEVLRPLVEALPVAAPSLPVYSGVSADRHVPEADAIRRMLLGNVDRPVLLWQTIRRMYEDGARVFVQVGDGGSILHRFAEAAVGDEDIVAASMDVDYQSAMPQLLAFCAVLWTHGVPLDPKPLFGNRTVRVLELPDMTWSDGRDVPHLPFLGPVLERIAGREIVVERILDLEEDLYLEHHAYIAPDGVKPTRERLPFLPITFSLEIMAEVGSCLTPGLGLIGFEDIRAAQWIELRDVQRLPLRIHARRDEAGSTPTVRRVFVSITAEGRDAPAAEGVVLFAGAYRDDLELDFAALEDAQPHALTAEAIYAQRLLWHGPLLQAIVGRPTMAARAVVAELEVLDPSGLFRSTSEPRLLCDPVAMDAVGQLMGLWALERGGHPYPISIEKLEIYGPTPPAGTRVPAQVAVTQYESRFFCANLEMQDGTGHVWLRARGVRHWVFHWPNHVELVRRAPSCHCLSHPLSLSALPDAVAQEVSTHDLLDTDPEHVARIHLGHGEVERYLELGDRPERQRQWLLGRVAAKDAVRRWAAHRTGSDEMLHPATFGIESDDEHERAGRPVVVGLPEAYDVPCVSLSHAGDRAIAVAHDRPVGIDIEEIRDRENGFVKLMATPGEQARLATLSPSWATRLWCAKEAAGKALGTGASDAPRSFEAMELSAEGGVTILHHPSGRTLSVSTDVDEDSGFVVAIGSAP